MGDGRSAPLLAPPFALLVCSRRPRERSTSSVGKFTSFTAYPSAAGGAIVGSAALRAPVPPLAPSRESSRRGG